jgi:hypothetical protein
MTYLLTSHYLHNFNLCYSQLLFFSDFRSWHIQFLYFSSVLIPSRFVLFTSICNPFLMLCSSLFLEPNKSFSNSFMSSLLFTSTQTNSLNCAVYLFYLKLFLTSIIFPLYIVLYVYPHFYVNYGPLVIVHVFHSPPCTSFMSTFYFSLFTHIQLHSLFWRFFKLPSFVLLHLPLQLLSFTLTIAK